MKRFTLLFLLPLLMLGACKKHPEASFSPSINEPYLGDTITMENASINAVSYIWTFGDGTTSFEKSPWKVYDKPGTYTVTLTAFSEEDKRSSQAVYIIEIGEPDFYVYMKMGDKVIMHYKGDSALQNCRRSSMLISNPGTNYAEFTSRIETPTIDYFQVTKGILQWPFLVSPDDSLPPKDVFLSFFNPGNLNPVDVNSNGTEISYWINGERWTNRGDQTNKYMTLVSREEYNTDHFGVKVKINFDQNIYHPSSGESKSINGIFVGRFSNDKSVYCD